MPKERTTNLTKLKNGHGFTWGEVVSISKIGPYDIVEFHPWKCDGCTVRTGAENKDELNYHVYIDGVDKGHSYGSLESAMIGAIAIKAEGISTRAPEYIVRMLGLSSPE